MYQMASNRGSPHVSEDSISFAAFWVRYSCARSPTVAQGAYVREGGAVVDAKTGKLLKNRPTAQPTQPKPRRRTAPKPRGDDSIFDTPAQRTAREDAERAKAKQRDAAS